MSESRYTIARAVVIEISSMIHLIRLSTLVCELREFPEFTDLN